MKVPSSRPPATPTVQVFRSSVLRGSEEEGGFSVRGALGAAAGLPLRGVLEAAVGLPACGASWDEHGCKDRPNIANARRQTGVYFIAQPHGALERQATRSRVCAYFLIAS